MEAARDGRSYLEAFEQVPLNVAFLGRGCSSRPEPLQRNIEAGAVGLKIHEDLGASPAVVDCALSVADQYDVAVAMHTNGLNEYGLLDEKLAAIRKSDMCEHASVRPACGPIHARRAHWGAGARVPAGHKRTAQSAVPLGVTGSRRLLGQSSHP